MFSFIRFNVFTSCSILENVPSSVIFSTPSFLSSKYQFSTLFVTLNYFSIESLVSDQTRNTSLYYSFLSIPFSVKWTNIVGRNSFLVTFGIERFEKPLLFKPWVFFFLIFLSCLLREKGLIIVLWVYLTVFNLYWCDITVAVNYWDQC